MQCAWESHWCVVVVGVMDLEWRSGVQILSSATETCHVSSVQSHSLSLTSLTGLQGGENGGEKNNEKQFKIKHTHVKCVYLYM